MSNLKLGALLVCVSLACYPFSVSADHHGQDHEQHHENISPEQMLADFEAESERRRSEEGEHFDEEAYAFEIFDSLNFLLQDKITHYIINRKKSRFPVP